MSDPFLDLASAKGWLFGRLYSAVQQADDVEGVQALMDGLQQPVSDILLQSELALNQQLASASTQYWTQPYQQLVIYKKDMTDAGGFLYGDPVTYGTTITYGQLSNGRFVAKLPDNVQDVGLITDKLWSPTTAWGVSQYDVVSGSIVFKTDPFKTFPVTPVTRADGTPDEICTVWLHSVKLLLDTPYLRFGADLGLQASSSPYFPLACQLIREALINGVTPDLLQRLFAAGAGVPICESDETVERVETTALSQLIITDKRVYSFPLGSTPVVSVGQVVEAGSALVDTVVVYDFAKAMTQLPASIPGLRLPGLSVNVPNKPETWTYGLRSGQPEAKFTVYGDSAAFWDAAFTKGLASTPLATLVGVSSNDTVAVNPAEFVISNILRPGFLLVAVKPSGFVNPIPQLFARITTLLPVSAMILTHADLGSVSDSFSTTASSDAADVYPCAVASTDTIDTSTFTDTAPLVTAL